MELPLYSREQLFRAVSCGTDNTYREYSAVSQVPPRAMSMIMKRPPEGSYVIDGQHRRYRQRSLLIVTYPQLSTPSHGRRPCLPSRRPMYTHDCGGSSTRELGWRWFELLNAMDSILPPERSLSASHIIANTTYRQHSTSCQAIRQCTEISVLY